MPPIVSHRQLDTYSKTFFARAIEMRASSCNDDRDDGAGDDYNISREKCYATKQLHSAVLATVIEEYSKRRREMKQ